MTAVNTFISYGDKSSAKRGFGRTFKEFDGMVEEYLDKVDGKWGFYKTYEGAPVNLMKAPAVSDLNVLNNMAPKTSTPVNGVTLEQPLTEAGTPAPETSDDDDHTHDAVGGAFGAFAMAQLTAPKAPEVTAPAVRTPVITKIEKNRPESNGVKRPSAGTICASVWDIATQLSNANNESSTPTLSQVVEAAEKVGINKYTARTQYARWRVFHGITGRIVA